MNVLKITMKPRWENDTVGDMEIFASVAASVVSKDSPSLDYANEAFGGLCPFPEYKDLQIQDDLGDVPFRLDDTSSEHGSMTYKGIYFLREIQGTLKWSYRLLPRVLPEGYRSSPYYDFRNEPLGLNGSGMFAFILPKNPMVFNVKLRWDMSEMPSTARGIWSHGEGDVEKELTSWQIRFTLFNTGVMNSEEYDDFGVYWFGNPEFDIKSVVEKLYPIFKYMKEYFNDKESSYRIFLRRDPFEISGGGSAVQYAFISGYSATGGIDLDRWFNVLIHEMTHTWPYLDDTVVGTGTWFTEGCTDYYCTMLPYRGGFLDAEFTVGRINEKLKKGYYDNIYREMPNMQIPTIQWKDRRAQIVPYGRGFVYLANVDAQLRRLGKGSIDEMVLNYGWNNPLTPEIWENFIKERLGEKGVQDFHNMIEGKMVIPEPNLFGPEIKTIEEKIELHGKKVISYRWEV